MTKAAFIISICILIFCFINIIIRKNIFIYHADKLGNKARMCRRCGSIQKLVIIYKGNKGIWIPFFKGNKDSCICNIFLN